MCLIASRIDRKHGYNNPMLLENKFVHRDTTVGYMFRIFQIGPTNRRLQKLGLETQHQDWSHLPLWATFSAVRIACTAWWMASLASYDARAPARACIFAPPLTHTHTYSRTTLNVLISVLWLPFTVHDSKLEWPYSTNMLVRFLFLLSLRR